MLRLALMFCLCLPAFARAQGVVETSLRPIARDVTLPAARWDFRQEGRLWTRSTLAALQAHGQPLLKIIPSDIGDWCPAYPKAGPKKRAAFWNGLLSALAKHESTWKPDAVGGDGRWYGLTQILPATARGYRCRARTGRELKNGSANLSCAVRIMAVTVPRDGAVALKNGRHAGVAADWGPMTKSKKRAEMARYLRSQSYCRSPVMLKPRPRPTAWFSSPIPNPKPLSQAAWLDVE